jgi:hypothetical protein
MRLLRELRPTRKCDECGELVASFAHAFVRAGKRIVTAERR